MTVPANVAAGDILVVDDDVDIRDSLASLLEARGYRVRTCANGQEAVAAIERDPPAFVLLDLMMPVMSGWEVVDWIKRHEVIAIERVLVMSASAEVANGVAVVRKPFDLGEILQTIRERAPRVRSDCDAPELGRLGRVQR
jgi:CheY-like chemotaxis protein